MLEPFRERSQAFPVRFGARNKTASGLHSLWPRKTKMISSGPYFSFTLWTSYLLLLLFFIGHRLFQESSWFPFAKFFLFFFNLLRPVCKVLHFHHLSLYGAATWTALPGLSSAEDRVAKGSGRGRQGCRFGGRWQCRISDWKPPSCRSVMHSHTLCVPRERILIYQI